MLGGQFGQTLITRHVEDNAIAGFMQRFGHIGKYRDAQLLGQLNANSFKIAVHHAQHLDPLFLGKYIQQRAAARAGTDN